LVSPEAAETLVFAGAHDVRISGEARGPAHGRPIVLSPGGGQTRHAWGRSAAMLAAHGFRAVSLDLRGHGESGWTTTGLYPIEDYADDVRAVAATLGTAPILVGASLGGIASLLAAAEAPRIDISGLCLVDVTARLEPVGVEGILGFMRRGLDGFATLVEAADAIAAYLPHRPRPDAHAGLAKNLRQREDGRYYWHWDPRVVEHPLAPDLINPRLEAAAHLINAPALLLRGEHSEVVTREAGAAFMALFPHGQMTDIPDARHMLAGDRNDAFGNALLAFACAIRDGGKPP
jgi:pimeloyl-ACP methyl ester carboxylesterase